MQIILKCFLAKDLFIRFALAFGYYIGSFLAATDNKILQQKKPLDALIH